jgi:hypothetical protein
MKGKASFQIDSVWTSKCKGPAQVRQNDIFSNKRLQSLLAELSHLCIVTFQVVSMPKSYMNAHVNTPPILFLLQVFKFYPTFKGFTTYCYMNLLMILI